MAWNSSTISVGDPCEKAHFDRLMDNTIYLRDGAATFTGEKTFQSGTVFNQAPDFRVVGKEVDILNRSGTSTVLNLRTKLIEIGAWDMDTDISQAVTHGLNASSIISVIGTFRNDADTVFYPIPAVGSTVEVDAYVGSIGSTQIWLGRRLSGQFDSGAFSSTSFNRGDLEVKYKA